MKGKVIWGAIALAFIGLVGYRIATSSKARAAVVERKVEAPLVRTTKVARADVDETLGFTGTVRAHRDVDVYAKLGGRVDHLAVKVGDRVRAGQVLASVEHREIAWQAKQTEAAVQAAKAGLLVAEAQRDGAKLELDRTKKLAEGGSAPPAALEGAELKMKLMEAQVAASAAQVAQASAAAGLMGQQVANARIEAPVDGIVTRRNVDLGVMAGQQSPAFSIQDSRTLKLESSVDLATYSRLARGMPVWLDVAELPGVAIGGRIDVLSPTLDATTRRATVEVAIDNAQGKLLPNAFARADVTIGKLQGALVVPRLAVLETAGGAVVYRIKNGVVEAVKPQLGPTSGANVTVLEGLAEGDEIALGGLGQLVDGGAVRVSSAAAATPAGTVQAR